MKATIKGIVFEGDVSEMLSLAKSFQDSDEDKQPEQKPIKEETHLKRQVSRDWEQIFNQAEKIMLEKKISASKSLKSIIGYQGGALSTFKKWLRKKESKIKYFNPVNQERFILVNKLRKEGLSKQEAFEKVKYMLRNKPNVPVDNYDNIAIAKANQSKEFPKLDSIDKNYQTIVYNTIENMIKSHQQLTMGKDAYFFGIEEMAIWREFLLEILRKQDQIIRHFNAKGYFKINRDKIEFRGNTK